MADNRSLHEIISDLKKGVSATPKKEQEKPKDKAVKSGKEIKREPKRRDNMDEKLLKEVKDLLIENNKKLSDCAGYLKTLVDLQLLTSREALLRDELLKKH